MSYRFHTIKKALIPCIILSLLLAGCDDNDSTKMTQDAKRETEKSILIQESVQVGTDLDIKQLESISDAYYELSGVHIDWVPISADVFAIGDTNELQLSQDIQLPEEIDMLLMHSVYTLANASRAHKLQPVGSEVLIKTVPSKYQDKRGEWYGLSKYARTLVYNKNKVNEPELINYAGLGAEKWFGRLCMTDIFTPENQAIAKMMWTYRGSKLTPEILANWQRNMGSPSSSNSEILSSIEQGRCDVGIVDSDIFWGYAKSHPNTSIRLMWANQINRGAMVNTVTAGITESGEQVGQALRFMEWLVSDVGQALLAFNTNTFPVINISEQSINMQVIRPEWTQFDEDSTPLSDIIENRRIVEPPQPEALVKLDID